MPLASEGTLTQRTTIRHLSFRRDQAQSRSTEKRSAGLKPHMLAHLAASEYIRVVFANVQYAETTNVGAPLRVNTRTIAAND